MKKVSLLNDFVYLKTFEFFNTEKDNFDSYTEEVVITDFTSLVNKVFKDIKKSDYLADFSHVDFEDLYYEVYQEVKAQYGIEVDEIYINEVFIYFLKEVIKTIIY